MKKITTLIIIILIIAAGVAVGIYQWKENQSENEKAISSPKPPSYKIYSNSKYGFSLEYPYDWYVIDKPGFDTVFFSSKEERPPMGGVSLGARIELNIVQNQEGLGLKEWIEKNRLQGLEGKVVKEEEITVADREALKITLAPRIGLVKEGPPIIVYLVADDYIIQINYTGRDAGLTSGYFGNLENFEHLLNTFKFD